MGERRLVEEMTAEAVELLPRDVLLFDDVGEVLAGKEVWAETT